MFINYLNLRPLGGSSWKLLELTTVSVSLAYVKLKREFFEDRDNGESEESLIELRAQRKHMKRMAKH